MSKPMQLVAMAVLVVATAGFAAQARAADEPAVREKRPLSLSAEWGWNSLAGAGATLSYHIDPRWSVDAATGLSPLGAKLGTRVRLNLLRSNLTPFVAAGMIFTSGTGGETVTLDNSGMKFAVKSSPFAQFVTGLEYISDGGFTFTSTLGYAHLLKDSNVQVVEGSPTKKQKDELRILYDSGLSFSLAVGYAFEI